MILHDLKTKIEKEIREKEEKAVLTKLIETAEEAKDKNKNKSMHLTDEYINEIFIHVTKHVKHCQEGNYKTIGIPNEIYQAIPELDKTDRVDVLVQVARLLKGASVASYKAFLNTCDKRMSVKNMFKLFDELGEDYIPS